jgi:hypothetical protein
MATSCGFESHRPHQATLALPPRSRRKQKGERSAMKRAAKIIGWLAFGVACALFALMQEGGQRTGLVLVCVVVAIICGLITGGKQE